MNVIRETLNLITNFFSFSTITAFLGTKGFLLLLAIQLINVYCGILLSMIYAKCSYMARNGSYNIEKTNFKHTGHTYPESQEAKSSRPLKHQENTNRRCDCYCFLLIIRLRFCAAFGHAISP